MTRPLHTAITAAALGLLLAGPALAQQGAHGSGTGEGLERQGPIGTRPHSGQDQQTLQQTNVAGTNVQITATAEMQDAKGNRQGTVAIVQTPSGSLLMQVRLEGVPEGWHGFHIHETGRCDPPDFKSAGGHWDPGGHGHGVMNARGRHAGDLPNVFAGADGRVMVDLFLDQVALEPGTPNSLLPSGSRSLVLHAQEDDYATDPAGNSGDRIGCGVIVSPMTEPGGALPESPRR